jgi:hypothetical protein
MSSFNIPNIPTAKVVSRLHATIRLPVHIPKIGCPGADSRSYVGEQFGNLPDIADALHLKHAIKVTNDAIYTLLKGQLPTPIRKVLYNKKALDLIKDVADFIETMNEVIGVAINEYNATIAFINQKQGELNGLITGLDAIPTNAQNAVNRLARQRYQEYLGELDQQVARLQTSILCLLQIG